MRPRLRRGGTNVTDLLAGLALVAIAGSGAYLGWTYGLGSFSRMGPGFYPFGVGLVGLGLGALIAIRAVLWPSADEGTIHWRPLIFICAAITTFALAIEPAGLLVTIVATTFVASLADRAARPAGSLALGVCLAGGIWVIFVVLLGLSIPVLPDVP